MHFQQAVSLMGKFLAPVLLFNNNPQFRPPVPRREIKDIDDADCLPLLLPLDHQPELMVGKQVVFRLFLQLITGIRSGSHRSIAGILFILQREHQLQVFRFRSTKQYAVCRKIVSHLWSLIIMIH